MVVVVFVAIFVCGCVSLSAGEMPLNMEACDIGDVIQNECTKCICTVRHVYECKAKPCKRSHNAPDFILANKDGTSCQPHKIYHQLSTICICRGDGNWPHESCYTTFRVLPPTKIVKKKCNKYAIVACNICMCNSKGEIENERCTQNDCDEDDSRVDHRRKSKSSHVFGSCLAKNWYSLAPCQFCYCLNNDKLVCNTGKIHVKGIQLGTYNFSLCGPDYLKEALEFMGSDDPKNNSKILRMGQGGISPHTTAKPRKHKSDDIRQLFEKADLERKQQKRIEKNREHEDIPILTENTKSRSKPIGRESVKEPREESNSDDRDDKADRDDDADDEEDEENERRDTEEAEVKDNSKSKIEAEQDKESDDDKDDDGGFNLEAIGTALRNSLPKSLKDIFNIRRNVVLNTTIKCEPGTHTTVGCNTCHCMKNGKMLCTNKKCK